MENKKCNCCNHDDLEVHVVCSSLGAVSLGYCIVCLAVGAEPPGYEEILGDYIQYDPESDQYKLKEKTIPIKFKDGSEYLTREQAVQRIKEK